MSIPILSGIGDFINSFNQPAQPQIHTNAQGGQYYGDPSQMKLIVHDNPVHQFAQSANAQPQTPIQQVSQSMNNNPSSGVSAPDPSNVDWLDKNVLPITRAAGFPDALTAGQWAIEGRKKDTSMFNLRFPDANGQLQVHAYQNIPNNVNDYIRTVNSILKSKGQSIQSLGGDPEKIISTLQSGNHRYEGSSPHPEDYLRIIKSTPEYQYYLNQNK